MIDLLRECQPGNEQQTWRILLGAESADEFAVGLDYAMEYGLVETQFAPQFRGEDVPAPGQAWANPIDGLEMVWIPGGGYLAGDPPRKLSCEGFFLARHPVTNEQFSRFVAQIDYQPHPEGSETFLRHWEDGKFPPSLARHPVTWVSFVDALSYCDWAGLTLPSEWLWEKAARGADGRNYPWGEQPPVEGLRSGPLAHVGTYSTCDIGKYATVRTPYGCENLVGNVSEWCQLEEPPASGVINQTCIEPDRPDLWTWQTLAAVRGSAYLRQNLRRMRADHRRRLSVFRRNRWVGFRPAFYPLSHRTTTN